MELPECCGSVMLSGVVLGRFIEAKCGRCGDVIYVKRYTEWKPQMIDD